MRSLFAPSTAARPAALVPALVAALVVAPLSVAPRLVHADTIASLFNTGMDNNRNLLNGGDVDSHYFMLANDFGSASQDTIVNSDQLIGTWAADPNSLYLSPVGGSGDGGGLNSDGVYGVTYRTSFTLPSNVLLSSVNIAGRWSTDNVGNDILVNGISTGFTSPDYTSFSSFALDASLFHAGTNTIDFAWEDQGGPGGLNVVYDTQSFSTQPSAAPEPGTLALMGGILPVAGLVARRRKTLKTPRW